MEKRSMITRRTAMLTGLGLSALALCGGAARASGLIGFGMRRMMRRTSRNAFDSLMPTGGFADDSVAGVILPRIWSRPSAGERVASILGVEGAYEEAQDFFNDTAERVADLASPFAERSILSFSDDELVAIRDGGDTAGTQALADEMGDGVIDALAPAIREEIAASDNPTIARLREGASAEELEAVSRDMAGQIADALYRLMARTEAAIRANPEATGDQAIIDAFAAE